MAQTRRVLGAARVARARREEPAQGTEEQDPDRAPPRDSRDSGRVGWQSMMTELTEQMRAVMQPTHEMMGDISSQLPALECKVESMDELVALTEQVVLLEEHIRDVRAILQLADD
ncbi:hypothetical protein CJ030_MR7G027954 [Morella rubra]|uniref:Uncharacterized protein n=1 Tax=Morella rubra TaxID=262757 RepID=A0A6A1UZU9_9ROSI|nr:hypothetical protein CJ030_MR7G027954 [Morella rubra]